MPYPEAVKTVQLWQISPYGFESEHGQTYNVGMKADLGELFMAVVGSDAQLMLVALCKRSSVRIVIFKNQYRLTPIRCLSAIRFQVVKATLSVKLHALILNDG